MNDDTNIRLSAVAHAIEMRRLDNNKFNAVDVVDDAKTLYNFLTNADATPKNKASTSDDIPF